MNESLTSNQDPSILEELPNFGDLEAIPDSTEEYTSLLVHWYTIEMRSLRWIATLLGWSPNTVKKYLASHGVPIRTRRQAGKLKWTQEDYNQSACLDKGKQRLTVGQLALLDTGYMCRYLPDPSGMRRFPYLKEHRIVAERFLGRKLRPGENVHHRDGQKTNNDPSNLYVLPKEQHDEYHHRFGLGLLRDKPRELQVAAMRFIKRYAICVIKPVWNIEERTRTMTVYSRDVICPGGLPHTFQNGRDSPYPVALHIPQRRSIWEIETAFG